MVSSYYESHITMLGKPEELRPFVETLGWKFSAIDGDPTLGPGVKCYATQHNRVSLSQTVVLSALNVSADWLENQGIEVIRRKVEKVIHDDRSNTVKIGECNGACVGCHLDDYEKLNNEKCNLG